MALVVLPGLIVNQQDRGMGVHWIVRTKVADEEDRRGVMPVFFISWTQSLLDVYD